jgi:hypothetical protein
MENSDGFGNKHTQLYPTRSPMAAACTCALKAFWFNQTAHHSPSLDQIKDVWSNQTVLVISCLDPKAVLLTHPHGTGTPPCLPAVCTSLSLLFAPLVSFFLLCYFIYRIYLIKNKNNKTPKKSHTCTNNIHSTLVLNQ